MIASPFHLCGMFWWWGGLHPTPNFGKHWQCHLALLWQAVTLLGLQAVKEG